MITDAFKTRLRAYYQARGIPWIECKKGERKDAVVQRYRDRFPAPSGVVLVGVAQARASGWPATKPQQGRHVHCTYRRKSVCVTHDSIDPEWGPAFLKVCSSAPSAVTLYLNGHEWAKRQLTRRRIPLTALENGFLRCDDPAALQAVCDRLSEADIEALFARWVARLALFLTKLSGRVIRPGLQALDPHLTAQAPPPLRRAFAAVDAAPAAMIRETRLAASTLTHSCRLWTYKTTSCN